MMNQTMGKMVEILGSAGRFVGASLQKIKIILCIALIGLLTNLALAHPTTFQHTITYNNIEYVIDYNEVDLFTGDAEFLMHDGGENRILANYEAFDPGTVDGTYVGRVQGEPNVMAIGVIRSDGSVHGELIFDRMLTSLEFVDQTHVGTFHMNDHERNQQEHWYMNPITKIPTADVMANGINYETHYGLMVSHYAYQVRMGGSIDRLMDFIKFSELRLIFGASHSMGIRIKYKRVVVYADDATDPFVPVVDPAGINPTAPGTLNRPARPIWNAVWGDEDTDILHLYFLGAQAGSQAFVNPVRDSSYDDSGLLTSHLTATYHEFAHLYGGTHKLGSYEGPTQNGGNFSNKHEGRTGLLRFGSAESYTARSVIAERLLDEDETTVEATTAIGPGTDMALPPCTMLDFVRISPDSASIVTCDAISNDFDYNGDVLRLVSVKPYTHQGRRVVIQRSNGQSVVGIEARPDIRGTDRCIYVVEDSTGLRQSGFIQIESLPSFFEYLVNDGSAASNRDLAIHEPVYNTGMSYFDLQDNNTDDYVTFTANVPAGTYHLRLRYQSNPDDGPATGTLSLNVNDLLVTDEMPCLGTESKRAIDYAVYHNVDLTEGENELKFSRSTLAGGEIRIFSLILYRDIDYRVNFDSDNSSRGTNGAMNGDDELRRIHPEVGGVDFGWSAGYKRYGSAVEPRPSGEFSRFVRFGDVPSDTSWEISVPDGRYSVSVAGGGCLGGQVQEIIDIDQWIVPERLWRNDYLIEGQILRNDLPGMMYERLSCKVDVTDGLLTVRQGLEGRATRLNYINIQKIDQELASHYPFNGDANDLEGGHHGVQHGGVSYTNGLIGQALDLDGVDDNLTCGVETAGSDDLTVAFWMNADQDAVSKALMTKGVHGNNNVNGFRIITRKANYNNTIRLQVFGGGSRLTLNSPVDAYAVGSWSHVVMTFDDATHTASLYINGELADQGSLAAVAVANNADPLYIGSSAFLGGFFDGQLDEISIYDYVIDQSMVDFLYTMGTPPDQVTGLAGELLLDDTISLDWDDYAGDNFTYYTLYRGTSSGNLVEYKTGLQDSQYLDTSVELGIQYFYVVYAVNSHGNLSIPSDEMSVAPRDITPPNPDPMTFAVVPYATGSDSISMTATTAVDPEGSDVEYKFFCTTDNRFNSKWKSSTSHNVANLTPSTTYGFSVMARDAAKNRTTLSGTASATTQSGGTVDVLDGIVSDAAWDLSGVPTVYDPERGTVMDFTDFPGLAPDSQNEINQLVSTNKSWSIWFKANSLTNRQMLYEQGGAIRGANIYLEENEVVMGIWGMKNTAPAYIGGPVVAGTWHHAVLVLDGNTAEAYLDGGSITNVSGGRLKSHSGIGIGYVNEATKMHDDDTGFNGSHVFNGLLDDLRIYDRSLTEEEVTRIFEFQ